VPSAFKEADGVGEWSQQAGEGGPHKNLIKESWLRQVWQKGLLERATEEHAKKSHYPKKRKSKGGGESRKGKRRDERPFGNDDRVGKPPAAAKKE